MTQLFSSIVEVTFSVTCPVKTSNMSIAFWSKGRFSSFCFFLSCGNMLNCFGLTAPLIGRACHIKISRKTYALLKATIDRSFIDKLHGKKWSRHSNCESSPDLLFLPFPTNQRNAGGPFLCISTVSAADVWQRCLVRYFMPCLHFFDFSLKVEFDLLKYCKCYWNFSSSRHSTWHCSSNKVKSI